jgi:hypothetical protein
MVMEEGKLAIFSTSQGMVSIMGGLDSAGHGTLIKFVPENP